MDSVKTLKGLMSSPERIWSISDPKDFLKTGILTVEFKNLTDQEKEDLSYLRMSNINGAIFDDRSCKD